MKKSKKNFLLPFAVILVIACSKDDVSTTTTTTTTGTSITDVIKANYKSAVTIATSGTSITLSSKGIPDHVSAYWGSGNALYEAPSLTGQVVNPGNLQSQVFVMTVPTTPAEASSKEATSLGPIGMALNGVPIFNDREGGNVPVDAGILSAFDRGGAYTAPKEHIPIKSFYVGGFFN